MSIDTNSRAPGELLLRLAPILALLLLALNDHFLKASLGNWWTGKLSDFAGMFFFPIALVAAWEWLKWARFAGHSFHAGKGSALVCCGLTALVFTAINLSSGAGEAYEAIVSSVWALLGRPQIAHTTDPTDLLALPMVALSLLWLSKQLETEAAPVA